MRAIGVAALWLLACSKHGHQSGGPVGEPAGSGSAAGDGDGGAAGDGSATGPGNPAYSPTPGIDAAPLPDASTAPPDPSGPPMGWWKRGAKACPPGTSLVGGPPPGDHHARCQRADGVAEGPEAWWDQEGHLVSVGANHDGRRQGRFTAFDPDGRKHREGSFRAGNRTGAWTTWWPDGKVFLVERLVDGRADGEQVAYAPDGTTPLARWSLRMGTGTMKYWTDDGHLASETAYVDGRASGPSTSYWPDGSVKERESFIEGRPDGPSVAYYQDGTVRERGRYARGTQVGDWASFDASGAQTQLVRRNGDGDEVFVRLYQDGKPLGRVPGPSPCDTKAGLEQVASGGPRQHACLERLRHFPGLVVAGDFAYDAGCLDPHWIVDCAKAKAPDPAAILARAGWATATGPRRETLASAYVDEVAMLWSGSTLGTPDPRQVVTAADGTVTVTAWTAPRSGMRPDPTITLVRWTFTPDGKVSRTTVEHSTRP